MFSRPTIRAAAGFLFGGTAGVLLATLFYSREWAPKTQIPEPEQAMILLYHLMGGLVYGMMLGFVLCVGVKKIGAWVGAMAFGVLGVYAAPIVGGWVQATGLSESASRLTVTMIAPILGALAGKWTIG